MRDKETIDRLMKSPAVRRIGLREEAVLEILKTYDSICLDTMLDQGYIHLGNDITIEIAEIAPRIHVLRGVTYQGSRKYKLKATMGNPLYEVIQNYYDKLKEDII